MVRADVLTLTLIVGKKAFILSLLRIMLVVVFCRGLFYKAEEVSFYSCFVESLIINSFCLLSNAFSVSIKIIMWARHPGM